MTARYLTHWKSPLTMSPSADMEDLTSAATQTFLLLNETSRLSPDGNGNSVVPVGVFAASPMTFGF